MVAIKMNTITSIAITIALVAICTALYISHADQSEKIATLSRQLSEVLDERDDDFDFGDAPQLSMSTLSTRRRAQQEELPSAFTYASDFGVVGDSKANDGPGE